MGKTIKPRDNGDYKHSNRLAIIANAQRKNRQDVFYELTDICKKHGIAPRSHGIMNNWFLPLDHPSFARPAREEDFRVIFEWSNGLIVPGDFYPIAAWKEQVAELAA